MPERRPGSGPIGQGTYVVQPGDCLFSIAARLGVAWENIWNDPANQNLKDVRKNPAVLLPGDLVTVPPKPPASLSLTAKSENRYKAPAQVRLRLKLKRGSEAIANARVVVTLGERPPIESTTDGDGLLDVGIPATTARVWVAVGDDGELGFYDVGLGWLPPVTTLSGVQARLRNLALYFGPIDGEDNTFLRAAIRKFQTRQGLDTTGQPNADTEEALLGEHGS